MRVVRALGVALAATLAIGAIGASAASAKSSLLSLTVPQQASHTLTTGDFVEFEQSALGTLEYASSSGSASCATDVYNGLWGRDQTNYEATDHFEIVEAKNGFDGGPCATSTLPIGAEVHQDWFNAPGKTLGTMLVTFKGTAEFRTNPTAESAIELISDATGDYCIYGLRRLKGTASFGSDVTLQFSKQKLKLTEHNVASCPKKLELTVGFTTFYTPEPKASESGHEGESEIAGELFG
jgi:hypothetical protein